MIEEWAIERIQLDSKLSSAAFARWLGKWKVLRANGWDVTVLLSPDESYAIGLGCR